jgi:hypothetical protein
MNNVTTTSKILCACKNCPNEAKIYLKIKFVNKGGQFCNICAVDLKEHGIVEEVVEENGC